MFAPCKEATPEVVVFCGPGGGCFCFCSRIRFRIFLSSPRTHRLKRVFGASRIMPSAKGVQPGSTGTTIPTNPTRISRMPVPIRSSRLNFFFHGTGTVPGCRKPFMQKHYANPGNSTIFTRIGTLWHSRHNHNRNLNRNLLWGGGLRLRLRL